MNIAHFTNTYLPHVGGVARSVSTFVKEQESSGNQVRIVAPEYSDAFNDPDNVIRISAIQNFNGSDFSFPLPATSKVNDSLDQFSPQIIHAHHPFLLGDTAYNEAEARDLPIVFTHHTRYEDYTHYVPTSNPILRRFVIELSTEFANLCDGVVAPSQSVADLLHKRGVEVPVKTIPTGIDLNLFKQGDGNRLRKKLNIPQDTLIIGHVGRIAPEKNIEYLSKAVALILFSEREAHFIVAGNGPQKKTMEKILREFGSIERAHFLGNQTGIDLADIYAAMNLFLFTSHSETQGLVLAEAMATGTPTVGLDAPGVRECIKHGNNGFLLNADSSIGDFARSSLEIMKNKQLRLSMEEQALRLVQAFGKEACSDRLISFYEDLICTFQHTDRPQNAHYPWQETIRRIKAEWRLIVAKWDALSDAMYEEEQQQEILIKEQ